MEPVTDASLAPEDADKAGRRRRRRRGRRRGAGGEGGEGGEAGSGPEGGGEYGPSDEASARERRAAARGTIHVRR